MNTTTENKAVSDQLSAISPEAAPVKIKRLDFYGERSFADMNAAFAYRHAAKHARLARCSKAFQAEMRYWMRYHAQAALKSARIQVARDLAEARRYSPAA